MKIAVIGGGSSYTPELMEGFIQRRGVMDVSEIILVDIAEGWKKTQIILGLCRRMAEKAGWDLKIEATMDLKRALKNASFVINQIRVGMLDARILDEKIPMKYGLIGQETTGAGGFAKALRTIPVAVEISRIMRETAPNAWLINFANPAGIVTEAIQHDGFERVIGLCNVPINMERALSSALNVEDKTIHCEFVGLNHLSWIREIRCEGRSVMDRLIGGTVANKPIVANIPTIHEGEEIIRDLRLIPSPYLNYYYWENRMFQEELEAVNSGKGTRGEQVKKIEAELFELYGDENLREKPAVLSQRGGAFYSQAALSLIESLLSDTGGIHVINVRNRSAFPELPPDAVVETNAWVSRAGVYPLVSGPLPKSVRGLIHQVKNYEQLTVEAAMTGSRQTALQALIAHPLVHGYQNAGAVLEDILRSNQNYLPQFR